MKFITTAKKETPRWWQERKRFLESLQSIKNYLYLIRLSSDEREGVIDEYEQYLKDTRKSEAYDTYQKCRECLKKGDLVGLRKWSAVAREKIKSKDYQSPPTNFDPKDILFFNQEVRDYKDVCNKVNDFGGTFTSQNIKEALL